MREICQSGSEGGGGVSRSLPLSMNWLCVAQFEASLNFLDPVAELIDADGLSSHVAVDMSNEHFQRTHARCELANAVKQPVELVVHSVQTCQNQVNGFVSHAANVV